MATTPKVSAIVPCYNRERFIKETISSILEQTYPNIEVIAIDDGCTDGTRAILESFGSRIRILEHPGRENRGQSAGINLGLVHATGKYIGILDSDDRWLPLKIERQVAYLEAHPDVGLVYGNGEAVDEDGRRLYDVYAPGHSESSDPARVLIDCYFFVPTNSLVRRSVFDQIGGFDESLRAAQDHDMAIRIAEAAKLAYVDEKWFHYRRHGDSISKRGADVRWRNGFRILEKAAARYPYPRGVVRRRLGVLHFRTAQCALSSRAWATAAWHLMRAFACDPARSLRVVAGRERITSPH